MEVIRGLHNLRDDHCGCVLTIGNYDGIHRGHRAVLTDLKARAEQARLPAVLMTFEPMPLEFFRPDQAPPRLSTLREKIEDVETTGLDRLLCVRFDASFAALSAESFIEELLVRRLGVKLVMVGEDFRFGAGRAGDPALLEALAARYAFEVAPMPAVCQDGERVSSTRVRTALGEGAPGRAAELLGRHYRMSGRVAVGERLGRTLGVPTINIPVRRRTAPAWGVYAVRARLADGSVLDGAANLGTRPTVNGSGCLLEVHLLDFSGDLYGQHVDVFFHEYLREEVRFDSTEAMRIQMFEDIRAARAVLSGHPVDGRQSETPS